MHYVATPLFAPKVARGTREHHPPVQRWSDLMRGITAAADVMDWDEDGQMRRCCCCWLLLVSPR